MDDLAGHLIPDYRLASISTRGTFRHDVGDLEALADSIRTLGLLTPVVVTVDGLLVCGKRRLAAVRRLGWETIPAWIPAKVTSELRLWAIRDDHTLTTPLTPSEQATLYAEYKALYAAQVTLRHQATRFQPGHRQAQPPHTSGTDDPVPGATPVLPVRVEGGKSRVKAAVAVTGADSHQRLEQVLELHQIAADPAQPVSVREDATLAITQLDADGKVHPRWQRVKHHQTHTTTPDGSSSVPEPDLFVVDKQQVRALVRLLEKEQGWWNQYDPVLVAQYASSGQWEIITSYVEATCGFFDQARQLVSGGVGAPGV